MVIKSDYFQTQMCEEYDKCSQCFNLKIMITILLQVQYT